MSDKKIVSMESLVPLIKESIENNGNCPITVTGDSMNPLLINRVSQVRFSKATNVKRGDMVLFQRINGGYVLHRVVKCEGNGCYTICGDAHTMLEKNIKQSQIIAVVDSFARKKHWIKTSNGIYWIWWNIHILDIPIRSFLNRAIGKAKRTINKIVSK